MLLCVTELTTYQDYTILSHRLHKSTSGRVGGVGRKKNPTLRVEPKRRRPSPSSNSVRLSCERSANNTPPTRYRGVARGSNRSSFPVSSTSATHPRHSRGKNRKFSISNAKCPLETCSQRRMCDCILRNFFLKANCIFSLQQLIRLTVL